MLANVTNKEISKKLGIPLSTVQRRVRNLLNSGLVSSKVQLNYEQLGYKTGLVHVYLRDGNINEIAKKAYELDGVTSIDSYRKFRYIGQCNLQTRTGFTKYNCCNKENARC